MRQIQRERSNFRYEYSFEYIIQDMPVKSDLLLLWLLNGLCSNIIPGQDGPFRALV